MNIQRIRWVLAIAYWPYWILLYYLALVRTRKELA